MAILSTASQDQLQQILSNLDKALYNHLEWYNTIIRTIACRLPPEKNNLLPDAHTRCRFGLWFYGEAKKDYAHLPGASNIEEAHRRMHQLAARVLEDSPKPDGVTTLDYDHFAKARERLQMELLASKTELEHLLQHRDPLTGALTRTTLLPTLREQQELNKQLTKKSCLVMVDVVDLVKYNESYGQLMGDHVLTTVSHFFINNLRPFDKLFRYKGGDFLILLPFTELGIGHKVIEQLRDKLISIPIKANDGSVFNITVSFGIAPLDPDSPIELSIDAVDIALYDAKSQGKNNIVVAS